jgi:Ca2+-binding RTX toxin-like protein
VFVNGRNVALFNQEDTQPLSVISENLDVGNFQANGSGLGDEVPEGTPTVDIPLEYDGISSRIKIVAPLEVGENTIKIGVADTGDSSLDSGLFVSNLSTAPTGGSGLLVTVAGTGGDDTLIGTAANEFVEGGDENDTLDPGGGDDVITGGNGDNNIDGGPGNDTVVYSQTKADLPTVVLEGNAIQVGTNTDVLVNTETLQFSDQAIPTSDILAKDEIGKIYVGYFGRLRVPPDVGHRFQFKVGAHSDPCWARIPIDVGQAFQRMMGT